MKYLKLYEEVKYKHIDPFDEEDWDELDNKVYTVYCLKNNDNGGVYIYESHTSQSEINRYSDNGVFFTEETKTIDVYFNYVKYCENLRATREYIIRAMGKKLLYFDESYQYIIKDIPNVKRNESLIVYNETFNHVIGKPKHVKGNKWVFRLGTRPVTKYLRNEDYNILMENGYLLLRNYTIINNVKNKKVFQILRTKINDRKDRLTADIKREQKVIKTINRNIKDREYIYKLIRKSLS